MRPFESEQDSGVVFSSVERISDWLAARDKDEDVRQQWYHVIAVIDRIMFIMLWFALSAVAYPYLILVQDNYATSY